MGLKAGWDPTYIALKSPAIIDREEQNDVSTGVVSFGQGMQILLLRSPSALEIIARIRKGEERGSMHDHSRHAVRSPHSRLSSF